MAFALEETLEADWVAVRPHVFDEREKHKFVFIVAWNEIEGKFAITCHNRTAQRQRSGSREQAGAPGQARPEASAPATPARSPGPRRSAACGGAGGLGDSPARRAADSGDARPAASVRVLSASGAAAEEIEVLDGGAEPEQPGEECSWAGLFSFQDLRAVHQQLCSVNSQLEPCLPVFPEEPSGMWTVLFGGAPEMTEQEVDALCYQLQVYLGHGLDTCGWKILSQVLFTEPDDPEEYYESLSELRQKGYEEVLQRARKRIQEHQYPMPLCLGASRLWTKNSTDFESTSVPPSTCGCCAEGSKEGLRQEDKAKNQFY